MKKAILLLFAAMHLSVIIYSNVICQEQALSYFYNNKTGQGKAFAFIEQCPPLLKAFSAYTYYTGTDAGYNFYAPNVCNQVIFMFTVKDKYNKPIATDQMPFHSREAYIRYTRIGGDFLKRSPQKNDMENQYLNAVVKSMALWTLDTHPGGYRVDADLLLYNVPTNFKDIRNNKKGKYIKLEHYEYSL